jgi:hypothetical protein
MGPAYERFIADYKTALHAEADVLLDCFDRALRLIHEIDCNDAQAIADWDALMELQRGNRPWRVRFDPTNSNILKRAFAIINRGELAAA